MTVGRDTGFNLMAALAPAAFTLLTVPFYLPAIGTERFGVLAICWTLIAALGFASLGMGPAVTYRLALMQGAEAKQRSELLWTALTVALAASIVGSMLVAALGDLYFRHFFRSGASLDAEVREALPLLAAQLPLAVIIGVLNGALQGRHRFGAFSALAILNAALLALAPLMVAYLVSEHLKWLIFATLAANSIVAIVGLLVCSRLVPLFAPKIPTRRNVKVLLDYGAWMSATALIAPLVLLADRLVIGALKGPAAVAVYVLPFGLVQQLIQLPASLTNAVIPRLPTLSEKEIDELQSSSLRVLSSLITPLCIFAVAFSGPFLRVWIGSELAISASPVAAILLLGAWIHGVSHVPSAVLLGQHRPQVITKLLIANLLPYLAVLYFATMHYGVIGAAVAWTIRAMFDPVLFAFTRPRKADLVVLALSAFMVFAATVVALALPWTREIYWIAMALLAGGSLYQHRILLRDHGRKLLRTRLRATN